MQRGFRSGSSRLDFTMLRVTDRVVIDEDELQETFVRASGRADRTLTSSPQQFSSASTSAGRARYPSTLPCD